MENKVTDALSHIGCLLYTIRVEVLGFGRVKDAYSSCPNFGLVF